MMSLPTGYGKSLCFAMLPFVYDRLRQSEGSVSFIVVCVTPRQSLMVNQYERFSQVGLRVEFAKKTRMLQLEFKMAKHSLCGNCILHLRGRSWPVRARTH